MSDRSADEWLRLNRGARAEGLALCREAVARLERVGWRIALVDDEPADRAELMRVLHDDPYADAIFERGDEQFWVKFAVGNGDAAICDWSLGTPTRDAEQILDAMIDSGEGFDGCTTTLTSYDVSSALFALQDALLSGKDLAKAGEALCMALVAAARGHGPDGRPLDAAE